MVDGVAKEWCHRQVAEEVVDGTAKASGAKDRRRVRGRLGGGEGDAKGIAAIGVELGGGETHREEMTGVRCRCTAQVQVASVGNRGTG